VPSPWREAVAWVGLDPLARAHSVVELRVDGRAGCCLFDELLQRGHSRKVEQRAALDCLGQPEQQPPRPIDRVDAPLCVERQHGLVHRLEHRLEPLALVAEQPHRAA
jgi:hypothetical protein